MTVPDFKLAWSKMSTAERRQWIIKDSGILDLVQKMFSSTNVALHDNTMHDPDYATESSVTSHTGSAYPHSGHVRVAGQIGGTAAVPDVRGLRETSGPTLLTVGSVGDGEYLKRSGTDVVGDSPAAASVTDFARIQNDGRLVRNSDVELVWSGYQIGLYDATAGAWIVRTPASAPALANTDNDLDAAALTHSVPYDIFAEATDGTTNAVSLVAKKWTNDTTRAVSPALWQGRYCYDNSTDAGKRRLWLGTVRLRNDGGTAKFTSSSTQRFISNYYNKRSALLMAYNNTLSTWTYNSSTMRESNAGSNQYRAEFVLCEGIDLFWAVSFMCGAAAVEFRQWFVLDATTSSNWVACIFDNATEVGSWTVNVPTSAVSAGYHYGTTVEGVASGTGSWWGWGHVNAQVMLDF